MSTYEYRLSGRGGQPVTLARILAHAASREPLIVTGVRVSTDELSARRSGAEEPRAFILQSLSADFGDNPAITVQDTITNQWGSITIVDGQAIILVVS